MVYGFASRDITPVCCSAVLIIFLVLHAQPLTCCYYFLNFVATVATLCSSSNGTDGKPSVTDGLDGEELAAYRGAIIADQNAKLSVFCSRPAVYAPLLNFVSVQHSHPSVYAYCVCILCAHCACR
jgi:hypothetical protein